MGLHLPDLFLLYLVPQVLLLALYIVGAIRGAGAARVLLAIWAVIQFLAAVATTLTRLVVTHTGFPYEIYHLLTVVLGLVGSILLGIALIIGRPGYRGAPPRPGFAPRPGYQPPRPGYGPPPGYPPAPHPGYGPQPGPAPQPGHGQPGTYGD